MYKLIALDMDGTLLREDKTISSETFAAIKNARSKGVKVVLTTGRPLKGIKRYLEQLGLITEGDYAITCNGSVVQETKTGKVIAEKRLTYQDLLDIYQLSKDLNLNIHALTANTCLSPKVSKYTQLEADINKIPLEILDYNTMDSERKIIKAMLVDEPEILDEAIKRIPKEFYDRFTIVKSAPFFLEFLNKSVNKGVGVELLASSLNIKQEEIICVGDADNDIHMIEYAGLGVAMANAFPQVKRKANYITHSNENDGVAHVINKFILAS